MAHSLAFIDGIGGPELFLIFILSLMLFGGKKLPELARGLGRSVREFKRAAAGVEQEIKRAIEEPPPAPRRPTPAPAPAAPSVATPPAPAAPTPTAASPGQAAPPTPTEQPD
ncbi:MAG TPA: twin-arginine translocase TatA/TatE family subunit [Candidatus Synoicihabitans sp.]|nr:twin-arginine translocase TatA/TatE family subunit [Candidatus Synoicihabitans sp.]